MDQAQVRNPSCQPEQQKKARESKKKQHVVELKEVQLTPQIGDHDLETKSKAARKFLLDGNKVKVGVRFKGRQMAHPELGRDVIMKFAERLNDVADIEVMPKMEGRSMQLFLAPKK